MQEQNAASEAIEHKVLDDTIQGLELWFRVSPLGLDVTEY